jgi:hypothetical protein
MRITGFVTTLQKRLYCAALSIARMMTSVLHGTTGIKFSIMASDNLAKRNKRLKR